ncbi:alkene reductase [Pseudomonas chlororaphis]|uniref:alkene reductase n=1 Tax=Pseudomonas chlororaphis TaxID=587753 RepID=UPI0006A60246|nr:alkene reductase [Pseudomonas chlororaphis]AZD03440.1 NADH:flavin oxidoreductase [Pseudomonas chlororaphis subsp. chlororaphis]MBM0284897.1 alkene reductase [Pseudomonas chlororaphis]MDO1506933.1 alkene reductase [Pseudomonas chlororaphis]ORM45915.1 alkene reductase [Pseudomonas chlororaphis subsp. chlororaphis]TWR91433.1 alkene reductase [Pseudomonas chlororaphis subsp. chlororaphis]
MSSLFSPVQVGRHHLSNRLVMAPMTRSRADDAGVPSELAVTYYAQRAGAGLIVSEGVFPAALGKGYVRTPGIETAAQVAAWKQVSTAVHARGGKIFMQMMHCGRISHPSLLPEGALPLAPSAIRPAGQTWTATGLQDFVTPHALSVEEIATVVAGYRQAARLAIEAGFDGVELHGASGYLPEQFLSSGSNQRSDAYGGSVENRARFVLEVLAAVTAEIGGDRVGLKISPEMNFNDITDANPQQTYRYLVEQLRGLDLAYLHVALFGASVDYHALLHPLFDGRYLIGGGLDQQAAETLLADGRADAVVFGAAFLANPDLPERFRRGAELNAPHKETFYSPGAQGYTDYPSLGA